MIVFVHNCIYDSYRKLIEAGGVRMEGVTTCIVLESKNLKETLYFYEGILGFKPKQGEATTTCNRCVV